MKIKIYKKFELAKLYFPEQSKHVALNHLMRMVSISPLQRPHYFTSSYTYLFSKKVILLSFLG